MIEGIGLINDVILTKLQAKMVPAKEKYGAVGTAICCAALAVAALFTKHYVYAVALAIGAYVFFSRFKGMTNKVHLANLAVAREKNQEIARFKVLFDEDDLIITTMDGEDPVEKEYRTFIKKIESEENEPPKMKQKGSKQKKPQEIKILDNNNLEIEMDDEELEFQGLDLKPNEIKKQDYKIFTLEDKKKKPQKKVPKMTELFDADKLENEIKEEKKKKTKGSKS